VPDEHRLRNNKCDVNKPQRNDEDSEERHHPGHRAPASGAPHPAHEKFKGVGQRTESAIGDRPHVRHLGIQHLSAAVAEKRIPRGIDVAELKDAEISGNEKTRKASDDHDPTLRPT